MFPHQLIVSTPTDRFPSLIDSVLHLRRQLGIDIPLSISDPEATSLSSREEIRAASAGTPGPIQPAYRRRDWLTWEQSPCAGKQAEKD
ncbi:hypothetical protein EPA93_03100 [Ktedonosporobacter rubrisoli]|uniref:Uncharacterized protein n=1 Tax=Ktedonosporobacter rubrisoli TaxID=2509675 RepID=A0A4P6JIW8_KTERU|nr:hypothetical protein [Ktedonosporobacter rubrisoli]QBD75034.1 hypothetical protein EPA93_03100 [Ktedonosporobacter rubrisoli]